MSFVDDIIYRSRYGIWRREDYTKIYYAHTGNHKINVLKEGEYKNYKYTIESIAGKFPAVKIYFPAAITVYNGKNHITLPDRNGKSKALGRNSHVLIHYYNEDGDYEDGDYLGVNKPTGKMYSVEEMTADTEAFIDGLIEDERNSVAVWR